jgi:hypothetical protein
METEYSKGFSVVEGTDPWRAAAQTLLDETGCLVRKWRSNMTGISYDYADEIEAPQPKTAKSFAVFAHEIGHQRLHRSNGNYPRWREEVEAWEFALDQFTRFGLPGRNKQRAVAVKSIGYAFSKAIRRGANPQTIHRTYPKWSKAVQKMEAAA